MKSVVPVTLLVVGGASSTVVRADEIEAVFPGKEWANRTPAEVGLKPQKLKEFSRFVGGRGCVVRHGYMVYGWGDASHRADVASACKPFYSHFLFKALEDGKIESLDEKAVRWEPRLAKINRQLGYKDREITWRHFANQTSCYQLVDKPGTAYAYNDWQMALFWDTLFLKVYGATYENVDKKVFHPLLTDELQCQDSPTMMAFGTGNRPARVGVSVRDFARFGLLYLRKGNWKGKQLISRRHATMAVSSPLPNSIPRAGNKAAEMIAGQRSIGSGSRPDNQTDHFGSFFPYPVRGAVGQKILGVDSAPERQIFPVFLLDKREVHAGLYRFQNIQAGFDQVREEPGDAAAGVHHHVFPGILVDSPQFPVHRLDKGIKHVRREKRANLGPQVIPHVTGVKIIPDDPFRNFRLVIGYFFQQLLNKSGVARHILEHVGKAQHPVAPFINTEIA